MSTLIMSVCWPIQMPSTAKAVLISLADNANDDGVCWPSQTKIAERTCLTDRTVRNAIKWLEESGYLEADRSNGRHTKYTLTPERGSTPERDSTPERASGEPRKEIPEPRKEIPEPRKEIPTNRKEPSRTVNRTVNKGSACALARPPDVDDQTWLDWLALRKAKKAPVTETVLKQARREAEKAGISLDDFLQIWCARGSQGLQADWLKPSEINGAKKPTHSAAADFRGKTYAGTPINKLPASLRAAMQD